MISFYYFCLSSFPFRFWMIKMEIASIDGALKIDSNEAHAFVFIFRSAKWARRAGALWMVRICHRRKVAMRTALAIIIKIRAFHDRNRTKLIASKLTRICVSPSNKPAVFILLWRSPYSKKIIYFICCSHSNANNDNWNGFDNSFETSTQAYQSSSSEQQTTSAPQNSSTRKSHKSEKSERGEKSDFSSLDVKASKPKPANKAKSIEDDAWNLLNN